MAVLVVPIPFPLGGVGLVGCGTRPLRKLLDTRPTTHGENVVVRAPAWSSPHPWLLVPFQGSTNGRDRMSAGCRPETTHRPSEDYPRVSLRNCPIPGSSVELSRADRERRNREGHY